MPGSEGDKVFCGNAKDLCYMHKGYDIRYSFAALPAANGLYSYVYCIRKGDQILILNSPDMGFEIF